MWNRRGAEVLGTRSAIQTLDAALPCLAAAGPDAGFAAARTARLEDRPQGLLVLTKDAVENCVGCSCLHVERPSAADWIRLTSRYWDGR